LLRGICRIAAADPVHASSVRSYVFYAWSIKEGRIAISMNCSNQTFAFD